MHTISYKMKSMYPFSYHYYGPMATFELDLIRFEQCMSQGSVLTTCILCTANIFPRALKEIYMCITIQHLVTHGTE